MIHNIAHRGASAYEPENTLRAFERAIEMGATMLEVDIHLSRDGHPVVIHDAELSRTTNGTGSVREKALAEIAAFDAGNGERVPTLAQVIDLARGRAELYIDLKAHAAPAPVVTALRRGAFADQAIVGSVYPWLPQKIKFVDPQVRTSVLVRQEDREAGFLEWALAIEADYVHPCWEAGLPSPRSLLTPSIIASIRRHGFGIILWHEERPAELQELAKLDVDGICTGAPDVLASILRNSAPAQDP